MMKYSYSRINILDNKICVFRDDLYPFLGGGNKGRKMEYIANAIEREEANALVTTGGFQSNHCRAVAVYAAQYGLKCTLVLHGSKEAFDQESGNAKIMRLSGAEIVFVHESYQIGEAMDQAMAFYKAQGFKPYYIWGGGHTLEGGLAYIEAIQELKHCIETTGWIPDYIFHASGTGSTQSGLLAGLDLYGFDNTQVIGISVGRDSATAEEIVKSFYEELCIHYEIKCTNRPTIVLDEYLMGGYGCFNEGIQQLSLSSISHYGFTLDTCYTAKAYYGMLDYISKNNLEGKNILFWHTGGIFNFLAE